MFFLLFPILIWSLSVNLPLACAAFINCVILVHCMDRDVKDWWRQTEADIDSARFALHGEKYYVTVIFAQQAAEKALKTIFLRRNNKLPPKIHDLVELCALISAPSDIVQRARELSSTYFSSRYPGAAPKIPVDYYNQKKAAFFLQCAEVVVVWARKNL